MNFGTQGPTVLPLTIGMIVEASHTHLEPSVPAGTLIWALALIPIVTVQTTRLHDIVCFGTQSFTVLPLTIGMIAETPYTHSSKRVILGRGIHTLIRHASFPSPTDVGLHNPPPKGAQRTRWHIDPGSGSDTICNIPDLPLARNCPLWHTRPHGFSFDDRDDSRSPPHSLVKRLHARERYPYPYKACFVPLHNLPHKGAQRPRWDIDPDSGSDAICNIPDHPLARHYPLLHPKPHGFAFHDRNDRRKPVHSHVKTRHARKRYPHPYKAFFVPLPNRCGTSESTPLKEASVPAGTSIRALALIPFVTAQTIR
ncbi:hypothetical protein PIB30_014326 [Stylosanthes scabra]|uniref:Uncharacterized protein n=1 Tax=Stylosanthes scabra TaxID=79078 RepID=A0ABU6R717_9FABA|nr:hypothetical protein [Stylosanthes scabra]